MPRVPNVPRGLGGIRPDVGQARIGERGAGAAFEQISNIGESIANFGANLVERRARAEAKDFQFKQGWELRKQLFQLQDDVAEEFAADDSKGMTAAFSERANKIARDLGKDSPSRFADDQYNSFAKSDVLNFVSRIDGFERRDQAIAFKTRARNLSDEAGSFQLDNADVDRARFDIDFMRENYRTDIFGDHFTAEELRFLDEKTRDIAVKSIGGLILSERYDEAIEELGEQATLAKDINASEKARLLRMALNGQKRQNKENFRELRKQVRDFLASRGSGRLDKFNDKGRLLNDIKTRVSPDQPEEAARMGFMVMVADVAGNEVENLHFRSAKNLAFQSQRVDKAVAVAQQQLKALFPEAPFLKSPNFEGQLRLSVQSALASSKRAIMRQRESQGFDYIRQTRSVLEGRLMTNIDAGRPITENIRENVKAQEALGITNVKHYPDFLANKAATDIFNLEAKGGGVPLQKRMDQLKQEVGGNEGFYNQVLGQLAADYGVAISLAGHSFYQHENARAFMFKGAALYDDAYDQKLKTAGEKKVHDNALNAAMKEVSDTHLRVGATRAGLNVVANVKKAIGMLMIDSRSNGRSPKTRAKQAVDLFMQGSVQRANVGYDLLIPLKTSSGRPLSREIVEALGGVVNNSPQVFASFVERHGGSIIDPGWEAIERQNFRDKEQIGKREEEIANVLRKKVITDFEKKELVTRAERLTQQIPVLTDKVLRNRWNRFLFDNAQLSSQVQGGKEGLMFHYEFSGRFPNMKRTNGDNWFLDYDKVMDLAQTVIGRTIDPSILLELQEDSGIGGLLQKQAELDELRQLMKKGRIKGSIPGLIRRRTLTPGRERLVGEEKDFLDKRIRKLEGELKPFQKLLDDIKNSEEFGGDPELRQKKAKKGEKFTDKALKFFDEIF